MAFVMDTVGASERMATSNYISIGVKNQVRFCDVLMLQDAPVFSVVPDRLARRANIDCKRPEGKFSPAFISSLVQISSIFCRGVSLGCGFPVL